MAQALISSMLEKQLGEYIHGISSDSLKIGFWDGKMVLENLILKPDAFQNIGTLVHGSIRKVRLYIPWSALGSSSVELRIEGVVLLLSSSSDNVQHQLEDLLHIHPPAAGSILSPLYSRLMDKLEIVVTDIKMQYGSSGNNIGITLDKLTKHIATPRPRL